MLVSLGVLFGQTIKAVAAAQRIFDFMQRPLSVTLREGKKLPEMKGYFIANW